jgi:hypothetical protein
MNSKFLKYKDSESLLYDCMNNSESAQYQDLFHEYVNLKLLEPIVGTTSGTASRVLNLDDLNVKENNEDLFEYLHVKAPILNYSKARGWDSIRCEDDSKFYDSVQAKLSNIDNKESTMSVAVLEQWGDVCNQSRNIRNHIIATTYRDLTASVSKRGYDFNIVVLGYDYWIPQTSISLQQDKLFFQNIHLQIKNKAKLFKPKKSKIVLSEEQELYRKYALQDIERSYEIDGYSVGGEIANGGFGKTIGDCSIEIGVYDLWKEKQNA